MKVVATKSNLMKAKKLLSFSKRGYDLLDNKRMVLVREMMTLMGKAKRLEEEIAMHFTQAYKAVEYVNITMGSDAVTDISQAIPYEAPFAMRLRSVMGVEIPEIIYTETVMAPSYGFFRSNPSLDVAVSNFNRVKYLVYQLASIENAIFKLASEIKRTQKRANALDKIQIPKLQREVKYIGEALAEKEREDFFRLKRVKSSNSSSNRKRTVH